MSVILATAGYDHKIRFWEAPSGICSRIIRHPDSQVNRLEITPDKQFLAAAGNPTIRLYSIAGGGGGGAGVGTPSASEAAASGGGGAAVLTLEGHRSSVTGLGFHRDGRYLYSCSEDGTVKLYDLRSPSPSRSFDAGHPVNAVALHPNQTEILSGDRGGSIKVWDVNTGRLLNEVNPEGGHGTDTSSHTVSSSSKPAKTAPSSSSSASIQAIEVSEDGTMVVASSSHAEVFAWTTTPAIADTVSAAASASRQGVDEMEGPRSEVGGSGEDNGSGSSIASTGPGATSPLSAANLVPVARFRAHPAGSYLLRSRISPDGRTLVTTSSDRTARLWDCSTWELRATLARHHRWVWDAVFSADSSYLVTASSDHSARLWNLRTSAVVRTYTGHQTAVTCVALNDSST